MFKKKYSDLVLLLFLFTWKVNAKGLQINESGTKT